MEQAAGHKRDTYFDTISTVASLTGTDLTLATENRFLKIKKLNTSIESYLETRSEDKEIAINRLLQDLSLSLDLSIFDPHTIICRKLFINIYDLINAVEPRSLTSWHCVDLLLNACKNPAARHAFMTTYQFLPCLARMIGDQLITEKKCRLLRLMLDLTCGIRIYCQMPHMSRLMGILCKWVESQDTNIVVLALGVLVNLCYKNMSNIYIMERNVNLKQFIKMCLALKGPIILDVYVCIMSYILEDVSGYVPPVVYPKFTDSTLTSVREEFGKDSIVLKQVVRYFIECVKSNPKILSGYDKYGAQVEKILEVVEKQESNPECLSIMFGFLNFLIESKVPQISAYYSRIIALALKWLQESTVSCKAIHILNTITVNLHKKDSKIAEPLVIGLNVFLTILNKEGDVLSDIEHIKRLGAIIQLLTAMIQLKSIGAKVTQELNESTIKGIFRHILEDEAPHSTESSCSTDAVNLYVYALALVSKLVQYDNGLLTLWNTLHQNRQIHIILAQAICHSPSNVKKLALEISSACPVEVSVAIEKLQSVLSTGTEKNGFHNNFSPQHNDMAFTIIPVGQNDRLMSLLENIEGLIAKKEINNLATSELMELYNYRMSSLAQAERAALCSVDALTKHCTHLQHRVSLLNYENTKLQHSELHSSQKMEELGRKIQQTTSERQDLSNRFEAEKGRYKILQSKFATKEKELEECLVKLNEGEKKQAKLHQLVNKVEENCRRLTKSEEKKDEIIKDLTRQINELNRSLKEKEKTLEETTSMLHLKSSILDGITKLANTQPPS